MTESTAVRELQDGTAVEAIEDGTTVGALKLAAIQRMYEEAKARITDLTDSCSDPVPNLTPPRPQPGYDQAAALVTTLAASCSDPVPDDTDASADTRKDLFADAQAANGLRRDGAGARQPIGY